MEDKELPLRGVALNRIFLGNPGTGKTTVAKLYGEILCHLGLLSKGEVVLKNSSDFIGSVMGSSENQTRSILAASEGCVLVIDEAYSLNPSMGSKSGGGASSGTQDPYRTAVIDTIVEQVQGRPGEDRAVVMLGYRQQMEDMLAVANPGLSRRFQLDNAFEFADYTDEQLMEILLKKCKEGHLVISMQTAMFAITQLAKARAMPNFGNAGAIDNLLSTAKANLGARSELQPEDFCSGGKLPAESGNEADIFADLVADESIMKYLRKLQLSIKMAKSKGIDLKANIQYNVLFVGAPGTGKTTIARKMGQVYQSLGVLPTAEVVEIKAADMIAPFVGQSQKKASEVLHRARGKVLFIDEAYQLNPAKGGAFMQEAVDALVQELTSKELMGQIVVILAGYESDIDEMLQVNAGLKSRFSEKLHFANFSEDRVMDLMLKSLGKKNLDMGADALDCLPDIAAQLCAIPQFGNGRDVETFTKNVFDCFAGRMGEDGDDDGVVEPEDLHGALQDMQASRKSVARQQQGPHSTLQVLPLPAEKPQLAYAYQSAPPPPAPVMATQLQVKQAPASPENTEEIQELTSSSPFLDELQRLLDADGLNSKEGVARISKLDVNDPYMLDLARKIAKVLGIDITGAQNLLRDWQANQAKVEDKVREQEEETALAKKQKRKALLPIWRCAVCGRADLNYIFCYVSPYVVRYDYVDV